MKKLVALILALMLLIPAAMAEPQALPLQNCHKVKVTKKDTTQKNRSVIRLWTLDTCLDSVDEELAAITQEYVERLGPTLQKADNKTDQNSRLEVEVRYSRTGTAWMSFLAHARTVYHRQIIGQEITSRTYDMKTGRRILLKDIIATEEGWQLVRTAVTSTVNHYFPDKTPDADALAAILTDEGLQNLDFTLHGMSLVVHLRTHDFYHDGHTLIEVPVYYPDLRPHMTESARIQTDNLNYYKTVALTFDDGPARTNTTILLNNLLEKGVRGTFFMLGNRINSNADLVQRLHDEGHAIGNHTYSHFNASKKSEEYIQKEIDKFNAAALKTLGITATYLRVPYGLCNDMIEKNCGMPLIQWSFDSYDWREDRSNSTILNNFKKQCKYSDGDIVLMHDIKDPTPKLASVMIEWLQKNGWMCLTVDEMFRKDGVVLNPNEVYYRCDDGETSIKKRD